MKHITKTEDVPLSKAMIAWNPYNPNYPEEDGGVIVVSWPDVTGRTRGFINTDGACSAYWDGLNKQGKFAALHLVIWAAVLRDGVNPKEAHSALSVIPEYRKSLEMGFTVNGLWE